MERIDEICEVARCAAVERAELEFRYAMDSAFSVCESPIERMMIAALYGIELPLFFDNCGKRLALTNDGISTILALFAGREEDAAILAQAKVLNYRADFVIVAKFQGRKEISQVIVECDGHDFHERTKEQAQRDRSRDREMTAAGFKVFRFTGSEIYRDPFKCAKEVEDYLRTLEFKTRDW